MWIKCWGVWYDIYIKNWWINYGKIKKKVLFVNKIEKSIDIFYRYWWMKSKIIEYDCGKLEFLFVYLLLFIMV